MPDTVDPRFGQPLWADDNSSWPGVAGFTNIFKAIYGQAAIGRHGLTSAMGSPSTPDVFYWATDTKRLWSSGDGSAWTEVSPVGGGGVPQGQPYGRAIAGAEGTSRIAARADHKHPEADWPVSLWEFPRGSPRASDTISAGGMTLVMTGSFTGPAGLYQFGCNVVLSTISTASDAYTVGYLRFLVNGAPLTGDMRCDMTRTTGCVSTTRIQSRPAAGPVTLEAYIGANTVAGQIFTTGSDLWAAYLGPS